MPSVASRGRGRRTINEINMVPFIDVMLVLLIIFMVTAPLITPSLINLPSVGKADRTPDHFVQVLIDKVAIALETFIEEFSNILQRNLSAAGAQPVQAAYASAHH